MSDKPDEKQFGLKENELKVVEALQSSYFSQLSMFLSFLAIERLAYNVTPNTQFRIEKGQLYVKEAEPPKAEEEVLTEAPKESKK